MPEKDYSNLHRGLVLKYFWQVMRQYKLSLFIVVLFIIVASALDVYVPLQYLRLWNVLSSNKFTIVSAARHIVILILILNFARWVFRRIIGFTNSYFQSSVIAGLRKQAFSYMIGHSNSFFADNFGGSLTQKVNKYAKAFERLMDKMVSDGLPLLIRTVGTVLAIYTLRPKYSLILGIFCAVFLITAWITTRCKLKYDIIAAENDTKTTGVIADAISNHSSIQLFTGNNYENNKVGDAVEEQRKSTVLNWYLWESIGGLESIYSFAVEFIIFWVAINDWALGLITLPIIILIQNYLVRLLDSIWGFAGIVRSFYDGFADAQEMALILDMPYSVADGHESVLTNVKGNINFNHVNYIYEKNSTKVLEDFSLHIPAGQKVALVGSSGAGKSTFVKLLMRLFDITSGEILIDGVNISKTSQKNLREQIAFVPQDPVLFHRTLMENIRYGRRDATDEEVKLASSQAHCDDFIDKLPLGYQTYVGERGVKLSGGERQRVAIARAILKNAPILVLDEATSALDSHSEALIQDALKNLIKGKTTIVIAHRLSTIRAMDRIVVIKDGKIVEDDTHDGLISKTDGVYKKLWDLQAGGFKAHL